MTIAAENLPTFVHDVGLVNDQQVTVGTTWDRTFEFRDEAEAAVNFTDWTVTPIIFDADPDTPLVTAPAITGDTTGDLAVVFTAANLTTVGVGVHNYRLRGTTAGGLVAIFAVGRFVVKDENKARLV